MTNSNNSVQIKINENNFLSNLGAIFSNTGKVINELIQNASRAKATTISFTTSVENGRACLTILDDGSGIADMQKLLSIAESGWSSDVDKCNPYGMGFLSTLFACEHIKIQSQHQMLSSNTEDIISGESIEIQDSLRANGTLIEMEGISEALFSYLTSTNYNREVDRIGEGYDIDVVLNGVLMFKHHSRMTLNASSNYIEHKFEYGSIYFDTNHNGLSWLAYLQGALISSANPVTSSNQLNPHHIVHLNDDVKARMPDRAELLDAETVKQSIRTNVQFLMMQFLQKELKRLGCESFSFNHLLWRNAVSYAPQVLNNVDFLTKSEIGETKSYELGLAGYDGVEHSQLEQPISRAEVESSLLFALPEHESEEDTININYLKHLRNALFVNVCGLHADHWIHKCEIREVSELDVTIELVNPTSTATLNGLYSIPIVLCDQYTLKGEYGQVVVETDAVVVSGDEFDYGTLVIPEREHLSTALGIYANYDDEWGCFSESDKDRDNYLLEKLYNKLRASSPEVLIQRVLDDAFMGSGLKNTLNNLKFSISFSGTDIVVTEYK
ncbi:ATP-binding protein (plasmid) [Vibrio harveyi]